MILRHDSNTERFDNFDQTVTPAVGIYHGSRVRLRSGKYSSYMRLRGGKYSSPVRLRYGSFGLDLREYYEKGSRPAMTLGKLLTKAFVQENVCMYVCMYIYIYIYIHTAS